MNKSIKVLLLSLVTIGMVIGCDQKASSSSTSAVQPSSTSSSQPVSSSSFSSSSSISVSNTPISSSSSSSDASSSSSSSSSIPNKSNWTNEEAQIMSNNLHGVVLPYTGNEESAVSYDAKNKCVVIQGGATSESNLANYKNLLVADGFAVTGQSTTAYALEKSVQTTEGKRFVYVFFTSDNGTFYLEANDPYYYSFPATEMTVLTSYYFTSEYSVPAFNADYYELYADKLAMCGYLEANSDDAGYSEILRAAGWTIRADKDSQGYYLADAPDQAYILAYQYLSDFKALTLYLLPTDAWNNNLIERFFRKYNFEPYEIPAFSVENGSYQFIESANNDYFYENNYYTMIHAFLYVFGSSALDILNYNEVLTNAGWKTEITDLTNVKATKVIKNIGIARIEVSYKERDGYTEITIYPNLDKIPNTVWPAYDIAQLLGDDVNDVLPEYTGATKGFSIINDVFGTAVTITVTKGTENDGIALYQQILENAQWKRYKEEQYGSRLFYISPNEEIIVEVYYGGSTYVTIDFKRAPYKTWPAEKIAKLLGTSITETLPKIDGAISYDPQATSGLLKINVECEDVATLGLAYYNVLIEAGYIVGDTDRYQRVHLTSPGGQLDVCFYKFDDNTLRIDVEF